MASAGGTTTLYAQWVPKYIQDFTSNICRIVASERAVTVYDRRDGNDYTVRYIGNDCWMTQNLRITGTINSEHSNFTRVENFNACEGDLTAGNSYDQVRCHNSGNTSNGVWYNYAAATVGQITGSNNSTVATEDICPKNWSLPGYNAEGGAGTIQSVTGSVTAFSPVTGGYYYDGSPNDTGYGYWWSTTADYITDRCYLRSNGSSLSANHFGNRSSGYYIRCVRSS